jgi:hypothetical protein
MCTDVRFLSTYNQLEQTENALEDATLDTFALFELRHAVIAQALMDWAGDRQKAARWMMVKRNAFKGRSGYDLVIDDDMETLLEHICAMNLLDVISYSST